MIKLCLVALCNIAKILTEECYVVRKVQPFNYRYELANTAAFCGVGFVSFVRAKLSPDVADHSTMLRQ
ncbi:MAG: hypothetical protein DHS20C08_20510 [Rhodomicrobium sp.]|nr:MAG: hypothetical protein DHS20C08_20510 [Rhodomicrobium sp.]